MASKTINITVDHETQLRAEQIMKKRKMKSFSKFCSNLITEEYARNYT